MKHAMTNRIRRCLGMIATGLVVASCGAQWTPWTKPVNLGAPVNTAFDEFHSAISADGNSLFIVTDRPGGQGQRDIWVSHPIDGGWGDPINVGPVVNTPLADIAPFLSPDGHFLYFMDVRDGGFGLSDIWVSYRADVNDDLGWEIPENLGPNINTPLHDGDPYIVYAPTGNILFFTRLDDPAGAGDWDIFQSFRQPDGSWGPASPVDSLNTPYRETKPWLCPDGLEIFFTSTRPGGFGQKDIWTSTRPRLWADWSTPINLGDVINTVDDDQAPSISWDCTTMYFQSDRPGTLGLHDIYMTTRQLLKE